MREKLMAAIREHAAAENLSIHNLVAVNLTGNDNKGAGQQHENLDNIGHA